jgi:lipid-A-disaccharide synthase
MTERKLFIFAGEHSGDRHGSKLLKALKQNVPHLNISGVGGPAIRSEGLAKCILQTEEFAVMGFTDVVQALPKLWRNFYIIRNHILNTQPHAVLLIDYPGFNLRLAKALRQKGYTGKIAHYIAPSVWAHGKNRIHQMAETLDLLMTIYPFEKQYFQSSKLQVEFVGNPLQEYISAYQYDHLWTQHLGIPSTEHLIALFPGSRPGEIARNLPYMLAAVKKMKTDFPEAVFAISCASDDLKDFIFAQLSDHPLRDVHLVPKQYTYELMRDSRTALAKSGTVTLELALHQCPTVVMYKLTFLNWLYAKAVLRLKLPYYCLANILMEKTIFPELIEHDCTADHIHAQLKLMHREGTLRQTCLSNCRTLIQKLQSQNTSQKAAGHIAELLA